MKSIRFDLADHMRAAAILLAPLEAACFQRDAEIRTKYRSKK